ncbi:hypothetical protein [Streptomyces brasiliscabiei]|uniref:hypothetical protein n=1 Tax=Streptomyces brasiliscabiei TaxID=2736302 RepID=UPI0038F7DAFE
MSAPRAPLEPDLLRKRARTKASTARPAPASTIFEYVEAIVVTSVQLAPRK